MMDYFPLFYSMQHPRCSTMSPCVIYFNWSRKTTMMTQPLTMSFVPSMRHTWNRNGKDWQPSARETSSFSLSLCRLDAVTALNKQFDKRPEDKARVLAHKGSTQGLVLIEQFFVKLVRVPAYELKLIYLKFREEAPAQLERMRKHIADLLESIDIILSNEQLPGILHLLCLLYNSITGKQIPGLHFDSLLSVLSTRTAKPNTTVAHLLCHLFEDQYLDLLTIFDDQVLLKLKDLSSIKYIPIYIDVQLLHTRYKQLNVSLRECEEQFIRLPEHISGTLTDLQRSFTQLFDAESQVKAGEKNLSAYFCLWDLSLEMCLSTLGQFIDKLRLAHMQNIEQRRRNDLLARQQRTLQTPTRSFRSTPNQYCSDTNIFRDQLSVPLTPITARQRSKINRTPRDRYSVSSRDVSHAADERQEQIIQNLLPNAVPRKRGHSPTARSVLTKRTFNTLGTCQTKTEHDEVVRASSSRGDGSLLFLRRTMCFSSRPPRMARTKVQKWIVPPISSPQRSSRLEGSCVWAKIVDSPPVPPFDVYSMRRSRINRFRSRARARRWCLWPIRIVSSRQKSRTIPEKRMIKRIIPIPNRSRPRPIPWR